MKDKTTEKEDFSKWATAQGITIDYTIIDSALSNELIAIGTSLQSVFNEKDVTKVRIWVSDLVINRDQYCVSSIKYVHVIDFLITYSEFLVEKNKKASEQSKSKKEHSGKDKTRDSLTVAYYLSRVNKKAVNMLGYKTQTEAFKKLAMILDQKPATIKNMRDEFDPYFDNGRAGWYQRELRGSRKEVFEMYKNVSDKDLFRIVSDILAKYTINTTKSPHQKLKIKNQNYKEIKSSKK